MSYTRREFGKIALGGVSTAAFLGGRGVVSGALAQAKPNSVIGGVQIGTITYSFRSMPDQSAEAVLKYILDSGVSAIELMGAPAESFAGAPVPAGRGGGAGSAQGGRGPGGASAGGAAPPAQAPPDGAAPVGSWKGQPCPAGRGGGGGGRSEQTPDQRAAQAEQAAKLKAWRTSVSMDPFKKLRKMYNDAGVTIYAWKQLSPTMSDEELDYVFNVAEALGCTHTTLELPTDAAQLKRIGDFAMKHKVYAAYHTHLQGGMTAFDQAFAASKGNTANVDFGHWVAAGNVGGTPMQFLQKYHDRISSFHLKDRTTPEHCALNLAWGTGDTPIKDILQLVSKNKWKIPASVELEYDIPAGSDAVKEVRKCVEFCRTALGAGTTSTAAR
jgi:sugar phosphate isomerase/epimerase